jgi:uncharacterized protein YggE
MRRDFEEEHPVMNRKSVTDRTDSGPRRYSLAAVIAASVVLALGCASVGAEPGAVQSIEVTGHAEISAPPDIARFQVVINSYNSESKAAATENAQRSQQVTNALSAALGGGDRISTASYSLQPQHRWEDGKQILLHHHARNAIQVEVRDLSSVGTLTDIALEAGADSIDAMTFTLEDSTQLRAVALALAAGRAKQKSDAIADALGLQTVRVLRVEERSGVPQPRHPRAMRMAAAESAQTPINPGPVRVTGEVVLSVEVGPAR